MPYTFAWTEEEKQLLCKMWSEGATREELQQTFPKRTWRAIQLIPRRYGVSRGFKEQEFGSSDLNPYYIVGFTDGEGYFQAGISNKSNGHRQLVLMFGIKLRADDYAILENIRNYFKCGAIYHSDWNDEEYNKKYRRENAKPQRAYQVFRTSDIENIIIPFFDTYPLRAKKSRDFSIWKEIVALKRQLIQGYDNTEVWDLIEQKIQHLRNTREYVEPNLRG